MSLESRSRVTAWLEGYGALGVFSTRTGGNADSEETKHAPGGGEPEEAIGGRPTTENNTISRRFVPERDGPLLPIVRAARGKRKFNITDQPLDADNNAIGAPTVYTGIVKSCNPPDSDSMSNDTAMFEIEQSTDAQVG
jgi:hypothetical protein